MRNLSRHDITVTLDTEDGEGVAQYRFFTEHPNPKFHEDTWVAKLLNNEDVLDADWDDIKGIL